MYCSSKSWKLFILNQTFVIDNAVAKYIISPNVVIVDGLVAYLIKF